MSYFHRYFVGGLWQLVARIINVLKKAKIKRISVITPKYVAKAGNVKLDRLWHWQCGHLFCVPNPAHGTATGREVRLIRLPSDSIADRGHISLIINRYYAICTDK